MPFLFESNGEVTYFTNGLDPIPRSRKVFNFPRPETLWDLVSHPSQLRARVRELPTLDDSALWKVQAKAIRNLEKSFADAHPRALIQMATGSGKTFTSVNVAYRLLRYASAKRILFLVDRANLGKQAEDEFADFEPPDDPRKFPQLYTIQRLKTNSINPASKVVITTPLAHGPTQSASDGEVFWFITTGSVNNGMPSWASLSKEKRWQIVTYLKSLKNSTSSPTNDSASAEVKPVKTKAAPPQPPYTDFRYEQPGKVRKITAQDLPAPYVTESASNGPQLAARPRDAWPKAPAGFSVQQYATGLDNPRSIRTGPNGDLFVAESSSGKIKVFHGITADGKPKRAEAFATGLKEPYGIAFYPPGKNAQWVYVGDTDEVVRFPYKNGDMKASGPAQHIVNLPSGSGHWTRDAEIGQAREH